MTSIDNIIRFYTQELDIDETPVDQNQPFEADHRYVLCIAVTPTVENCSPEAFSSLFLEDAPCWVHSVETVPFIKRGRYYKRHGTEAWEVLHGVLNWTSGSDEHHRWLQHALRRRLQAMQHSTTTTVAQQQTEPTRAQRAITAVTDLAQWLGVTEADAADLAGGYRRSYYNWRQGAQPYPAKTLDLYEAHAFVAALVEALGVRGARAWLAVTEMDVPRQSLLGHNSGRAKLSRLAAQVLLSAKDEVRWQPDEELEYTPAPTPTPASHHEGLDLPIVDVP